MRQLKPGGRNLPWGDIRGRTSDTPSSSLSPVVITRSPLGSWASYQVSLKRSFFFLPISTRKGTTDGKVNTNAKEPVNRLIENPLIYFAAFLLLLSCLQPDV
jgi:hypothetical protein